MIKFLFKLIVFIAFLCFCSLAWAQNLKPTDKLALLTGVVTNFKGKPLSKEVIMFVNDKTKAVVKVNTDAAGKFAVLIPVNGTYSLKYKLFTDDMDYTKMVVPADKEATYEVGIKIDPPKEFVLKSVYFDTGKSSLKASSFSSLNDLVEILNIKNTMVVEIQGHTDDVGKEEDNLKLSQARAEEVRNYLISKGIVANRVSAKGYGQTIPVADNSTDAGKAKNRRTSLKVIKE
jgi:outer membrane protein OmpA-like peptidoglycan-associated protein